WRVSVLSNPTANGAFSYGVLNSAGVAAITKTGTTQFRIYFAIPDNDDLSLDVVHFNAGEDGTAAYRPALEVTYLP
ncbi:MAG: hypothetical protein ACJ75H_20040, partial [Thermoanaerobaculia bacterium]